MPPLSPDSPAVQTHLTFLQGIIQRMAGNSASAKTWCIAIVAALLTLSAEKAQPILAEIALLPTLLFMFLDAYYLALERCFRQQYNQIVQKLNENTLYPADLYKIDRCQGLLGRTIQALGSFSVWGFYGGLIVGIILLLSIMA
ncbi:MAG: hypothetical protein RMK19_05145 [Bacteroidia bacterium]|nr:hypothetical protein [Bacteroidia bacterium]